MACSPGPQPVPWPVASAQAILKSVSMELAVGTALAVALTSSQQTWTMRKTVPQNGDYNGCSYDTGVLGMPILAQAAAPTMQALPGVCRHLCLLRAMLEPFSLRCIVYLQMR